MDEHSYIAFDLGAESGRTILGTLDSNILGIRQVTRFPNDTKDVGGHIHWNIDALFDSIKEGLRACVPLGLKPESIGIDTWGVDFGLVDKNGAFFGSPYAYRDKRTDGMMEEFFKLVPQRRVYELTGIQFMQLNTLFQLFAASRQEPECIEKADRLLFMPDIFNYLLTGETKTEFTFATTSQLYNPRTHSWEKQLFSAMGISSSLMQEIVLPGTLMGRVRKSIAEEVGFDEIPVTAVASHDTGSAIAAVPAEGEDWAYISSGTWSLMGVEIRRPIITDEAMSSNFTNEGGVDGTFRFLKNIMGLWPLQQCRKEWAAEIRYDYEELIGLAERVEPFRSLIDPDYRAFFHPKSMPEAIRMFCTETAQAHPRTHAEFVRCILESLALKYRSTLDKLQTLTGRRISKVHIIGGGAQNKLLCQYAADAMGATVVAGPVEATAIGNILLQARAAGRVGSLAEIRNIVRRSFSPTSYQPQQTDRWSSAYERYKVYSSGSH